MGLYELVIQRVIPTSQSLRRMLWIRGHKDEDEIGLALDREPWIGRRFVKTPLTNPNLLRCHFNRLVRITVVYSYVERLIHPLPEDDGSELV